MKQEQLESLRAWFDDYVTDFYGDDKFINANLKLKEDHSRRTCQEMLYLADALGLDTNSKHIAEVIALFHDVGRFEQFVKYRTYNDSRSINHSLLGVNILCKQKVLETFDKQQEQLILKAIEYHGLKELPKDLDGQCLMLSKMIRDADKLDVLYVVTDYYKQYKKDPEGFTLELEFPDEPAYSPHVVQSVINRQQIDYSTLRTLNDIKILQLGWVYDVNFTATLKRIKKRRFLEMLIDFLPRTQDIEKVKEAVFEYVDSRLRQDG